MPQLIAITTPNPPPDPSLLPPSLSTLGVTLDISQSLTKDELHDIQSFRRAANYIAAAMIFLRKNTLLSQPLSASDIKPRLLGHWGTCPGLTLIYAHLNRLITLHSLSIICIIGPGHGAPAILSCLWLEDSLSPFLPKYTRNKEGLDALISGFSAPGGFPSHINAETPGAIHEGGELGYALSVAFGAVMDKKDLIVACVVGDGEAETGPTATAWHGYKYIDPAESGAVIPIVHVNGFKISERTIYGTMDDLEIIALFSGYGYQVRIVEDVENIDLDMAASLDWAVGEIKKIQNAARTGKAIVKPRWPVLILRTPKGFTGPKQFHGELIEGSFHSHQVPLPLAKTSTEQLDSLNTWLTSYRISELIDTETGEVGEEVKRVVPVRREMRMGQRGETNGGGEGGMGREKLVLPDWKSFGVQKGEQESCMKVVGRYLREVIKLMFSPDELMSNKLDEVFSVTSRNFQSDPTSRAIGGRIIEILSEHTCQGMLQGYTLTGRTGLFPSYESFLGIVGTMMVQYCKFVKMARETSWRNNIGSINYIETSTWARQEHNGFSHQNPGFIGSVLNLKPKFARVYFPPDANCFVSTVAHCLGAENYVNLMVGSKQPTPVWLTAEEAGRHCVAGASVWGWASTEGGVEPDVVLVGIGVEVTFEVIAAASLLRLHVPSLRVRVVNVTDLMILSPEHTHPHSLTNDLFEALFTRDRPVHFNYHGYPSELRSLLFGRRGVERVSVAGYSEEGTTTTPFCMMLLNETSRYHVAAAAIRGGATVNPRVAIETHKVMEFLHMAEKAKQYAFEHGEDPEGTFDTPTFD